MLISLFALFCIVSLAAGQESDNNTTEITFDRVLVVVLENQPLRASMQNSNMRDILNKGTLLTQYYALTNPSQPNYIGLLAGDLLGVSGDGIYNLAESNLVDLMEAKNVTWKSYQENYPGNCFAGDTGDKLYKRKHNPFISFNTIRDNPLRCEKIADASELLQDLKDGNVPQYSFYTPNMNNNGHDTGLAYAASWLSGVFLPTYFDLFNSTGNALLVITFDEGVLSDNQIYTLLIGPMIPEGNIDSTKYNHYSLLRLIEDNFQLGSLYRHDADAVRITSKFFVRGTIKFEDKMALALGIGLPLIVLITVGVVVYILYKRRVQKQRKYMTPAELNSLIANVGGDDNTV